MSNYDARGIIIKQSDYGEGHRMLSIFTEKDGIIKAVKYGAKSTKNRDSASSQFFIMHEDAPHLDGSYAAFGKVTKGIEIVDEIAGTPVSFDGQSPVVTPVIESMVVL